MQNLLYHEYAWQTALCSSAKHSLAEVFQTMISSTKFIAPTDENKPVVNGMIVQVNVLLKKNNPICVTVVPKQFTVINRTLKGHILHPGSVTRKLVQHSGMIVVDTQGVGTGVIQGSFNVINYVNPIFPLLPPKHTPSGQINDAAAAVLWGGVDHLLKVRLEKR